MRAQFGERLDCQVRIALKDRWEPVARVLVRLAALCGDCHRLLFSPADVAPANPFATTLGKLEEAGLIETVMFLSNPEPYLLTLEGWLQAQRAAGHFDSAEFSDRRARVCAAMKRAVAGDVTRQYSVVMNSPNRQTCPRVGCGTILEGAVLHRLDPKGRYSMRFEDGTVDVRAGAGRSLRRRSNCSNAV